MAFPNWLPEDPSKKAAAKQGLMQFGASLLGGRGNFGEILGQGLQTGAQGYHGALAQQQAQSLQALQAKRYGLETQKLQAEVDEPMALAQIAGGIGQPSGIRPVSALPQIGQAQPEGKSASPEQAAPQSEYDRQMALARAYGAKGFQKAEAQAIKNAQSLLPKVKDVRELTMNGKRVMVQTFEDGRPPQVLEGYTPAAEKLSFQDRGGSIDALDPFTGKPLNTFKKTQSPDNIATNITSRANNRDNNAVTLKVQDRIDSRIAAGASAEPTLPPEALSMMAQQYLAGDKSVLQNLGRGVQGATNLVALRKQITTEAQAKGMTGPQIAAAMADYSGQTAGLRTAGTISARIENASAEAAELIPIALKASETVARSGLLPFGKAQVMFNTQTNDPRMAEFATANIGLATAYAGVMARGGKATVSDMEHAREILSTAKDHASYVATVNMMKQEIVAAQRAPNVVRGHLRDQIGGKGAKDLPKLPPAIPAGWSVRER